jgi:L-threonylcarbamoyladenylate synthase
VAHIVAVSEQSLRYAADLIKAGDLVAFPTETVYGLGANAFDERACARIFTVKRRPSFDPLIVHIADFSTLDRIIDRSALNAATEKTMHTVISSLWPGPLTLVLPKHASIPPIVTSGLSTVAVRMPSHPVAQQLIRLSTGAIAAPSANRFGFLSPTTPQHVEESLGTDLVLILDGGHTTVGVESTILDLSEDSPHLLRPGGISREQLESLIGPVAYSGSTHKAPGQLKSHYAPRTPLYMFRDIPFADGTLFLFFDSTSRDKWCEEHNIAPTDERLAVLSPHASLEESAVNLFSVLHELDKRGAKQLYVQQVPLYGLGLAIHDRLQKASNKKKWGQTSESE